MWVLLQHPAEQGAFAPTGGMAWGGIEGGGMARGRAWGGSVMPER